MNLQCQMSRSDGVNKVEVTADNTNVVVTFTDLDEADYIIANLQDIVIAYLEALDERAQQN